ncbi:MAG: hypothetical protein WKF94_11735 [Solirubrobacteraceae bacterium]
MNAHVAKTLCLPHQQYGTLKELAPGTAAAAASALVAHGHHFVDVFGEAGDWGGRRRGLGLLLSGAARRPRGRAGRSTCCGPGAVSGEQDLYAARGR